MLLKLLKHEVAAYLRQLKYVYIVAFVLILLSMFGLSSDSILPQQTGPTIFLFFLSFIYIMFVFFYQFYLIVKRYANTMFGDTAYLTNTLPIHPFLIVLAKTLGIIIIELITFVFVGAILSMLVLARKEFVYEFTSALSRFLYYIDWEIVTKFIVQIFVSQVVGALILITAITIAHLRIFYKQKYIVGIIAYFTIQYFIEQITQFIIYGREVMDVAVANPFISLERVLTSKFYPNITLSLVIIVGFIFLNSYLVKNHLNVE